MRNSGRARAIEEATRLKEAWVVGAAFVGFMPPDSYDLRTPDYSKIIRRQLHVEVDALRADFRSILEMLFQRPPTNAVVERSALFFQKHYAQFIKVRRPIAICTVQELAAAIGMPPGAKVLDAPPYTEVLMQGFRGAAYRHPEYMLVRDIQFLYDAYWQTEQLVRPHQADRQPPPYFPPACEQVQSLARATVLACFSLLEATVSGLARAHEMTARQLGRRERKVLLDNHGALVDRLFRVPEIITGRPLALDLGSPPLRDLFGVIKQRRDAFVHCEPGAQESRPGFVKQDRFHDVAPSGVDDAVRFTADTVRALWRHVHEVGQGPAWLKGLGNRKAFKRALDIVPTTGTP